MGDQEDVGFDLIYRREMGQSRKSGGRKPGFIDTVVGVVDDLYADVVQHITPWTPTAPKVKRRQADDIAAQPQPETNAQRPTFNTQFLGSKLILSYLPANKTKNRIETCTLGAQSMQRL